MNMNALNYATYMHRGQVREDNTSYIEHPKRVAEYINSLNIENKENLIKAALLHDIIEDTDASFKELEILFGSDVANLVLEVTTDEKLKNKIGKLNYLKDKVLNISHDALILKLSDRLDNVRDLVNANKEFQIKYSNETYELINHLMNNRKLLNIHKKICLNIVNRLIEYNNLTIEKEENLKKMANNLTIISLENLLKYVNLQFIPSSLKNNYDNIIDSFNPSWLNNYNFEEILDFYKVDNSFKERVYKELDIIKKDEKLNLFCYSLFYILYHSNFTDYYDIWHWGYQQETFKNNGSFMIPVISLLCGYPIHTNTIKSKNYDNEQIDMQKYNVNSTLITDNKRLNLDGIRFSQMLWGSYFMKGYIVQKGRLQYEVSPRNKNRLDNYYQGNYEYIKIHIPRGNKLDIEEVKESLNDIDNYINKYFPETKDKKLIYFTNSWLLSKEVREILNENSNIIKFQNLFDIIEDIENKDDFLKFVFDASNDINLKDLKEETSLQRELKRKLVSNEKLHIGLGILK